MVISLYIKELQYRLTYAILGTILCFLVSYSYAVECFYILSRPFCELWGSGSFLLINIFEVLFGYIKIAMVISLVYLLVIGGVHCLLFLVGGVYRERAKNLWRILVLLLAEVSIFTYIIYRYILGFIYEFIIKLANAEVGNEGMFDIEPRMLNYIELNIKLIFLLLLVLLLPNLLFLLGGYLFKDSMGFIKYRSWFYLLLLLLVISILPPDIFLHLVVFMLIMSFLELIVMGIIIFKTYRIFVYRNN